MDAQREMLRHTLATLAYRGRKAVSDVDPSFGDFRPAPGSRSAGEILAHVGDLMDWAVWLARGEHRWAEAEPQPWPAAVQRFFAGLEALDHELATRESLGWSAERIFQGPIADALTHVGQICMMRRLAGVAVRGENYAKATITAGRVGLEQAAPLVEFD